MWARAAEAELDALLVTHLVNVRYLTGFTGTNALALLDAERRVFVTDFRYVTQAAQQVHGFDRVRAQQDLLPELPSLLPGDGALRLGFDDAHVSVAQHRKLAEVLPDSVELVPAGGLVETERRRKEPEEVERIRAASQLADEVLTAVLTRGVVGRTEHEVAVELEHEMRVHGARRPSFPSIVAVAENAALPHAVPRDVAIPAGTLLTIDWGVELEGYCSDCTRTFATGPLEDEAAAIYDVVLRAQVAGLEAVRAEADGRDVDAVARELIAEAGYGDHFGHGLGHGVGIEVHEAPRLARTSKDTLESGNVVTVEPGIYLPDRFGVRIEDLVVVTDDGSEVLNGLGKDLVTVE